MSARLINCPDCGRKVSKMPPACTICGRPFSGDDYDECEPPRWPLRLVFSLMVLFVAVGSFLAVIGEALLGFGLVIAGIDAFPSYPVLGGALIVCGGGVFLRMIGKGVKTVFGGR